MIGWRNVFGLMAVPVVVTSAVFLAWSETIVRSVARSVSEGDPRCAGGMPPQHSFGIAQCIGCVCIYAVTFGGFVGLCSVLPLFFHDQYGMDLLVSAGTMTALCGLAGSRHSPISVDMSRIGSAAWRSLRVVLPIIMVLTSGGIGYLPPCEWCGVLMILAVGIMGFGNGAVFQIVSQRFHSQIGLASGLVGAAGGLGGFFVADLVGHLEGHDRNLSNRILGVCVVAAMAWLSAMHAAWPSYQRPKRFPSH